MSNETNDSSKDLNKTQMQDETVANSRRRPGVNEPPAYHAFAKQPLGNAVPPSPDADTFPRSMSMSMARSMARSMSMALPRSMSMALPRSMSMALARSMSMSMSMARGERLEDLMALQDYAGSLEPVRTDVEWIDYVYLLKFLKQADWIQFDDQGNTDLTKFPGNHYPQDFTKDGVEEEIQELLWKQAHPQRYERLPDIFAEAEDYTPRFMHTCGIDPHSHAQTVRLIRTLGLVAYCVVMPFKKGFRRLRPSQASREISPAILVPAHYSYPSGHATQAHLTALALKYLFSEIKLDSLEDHLENDAMDIAQNREWAGVHYASDSEAGEQLAIKIWETGKDKAFADLLERARQEWEVHPQPTS